MDRFDIVSALRTFATSKGWHFVFGNAEYVNTNRHDYLVDECVLFCYISPQWENSKHGGAVQNVSYRGWIMFGRKFESDTHANLDETYEQKFDNRLLFLVETIANQMGVFACQNQLELSMTNTEWAINTFSDNIDFVQSDVIFSE